EGNRNGSAESAIRVGGRDGDLDCSCRQPLESMGAAQLPATRYSSTVFRGSDRPWRLSDEVSRGKIWGSLHSGDLGERVGSGNFLGSSRVYDPFLSSYTGRCARLRSQPPVTPLHCSPRIYPF